MQFNIAQAIVYREVRLTGRFNASPAVLSLVNARIDRLLQNQETGRTATAQTGGGVNPATTQNI